MCHKQKSRSLFFFSCRVSPSFHHSFLSFPFVMSQLLNRIRRRASHDYMAIPNEHSEQHFESAEVVRDIIIGLSGKIDLSTWVIFTTLTANTFLM